MLKTKGIVVPELIDKAIIHLIEECKKYYGRNRYTSQAGIDKAETDLRKLIIWKEEKAWKHNKEFHSECSCAIG